MRYKKTELGQTALHNRALALTPRQRSAFIMFDGKRSLGDVLKATIGLGVTHDDIEHLIAKGLLAESTQPVDPSLVTTPLAVPLAATPVAITPAQVAGADKAPSQPDQAHYSRAYPIATRLTAALGLRGFRLNLAVEAAGDLAKLRELAPKIKDAVGIEKFKELESALYD